MTEEFAITIVRETADGHHTVRAASPAEALRLLLELEAGLGISAMTPLPVTIAAPSEPAAAPSSGAFCPIHGQDKLRQREQKRGGGYYCAGKYSDGTWCSWDPKKAAA